MPITRKVRDWFKSEFGYSIDDAFETLPKGCASDDLSSGACTTWRGNPMAGKNISLQGVDDDNDRLLDRLTQRIGRHA